MSANFHDSGTTLNSGENADSKKENILERLNKRNKERQNYLDVKIEQRNKENVELEGTDYFAQTFTERARAIEEEIQNISLISAATDRATSNTADLTRIFADLTIQIQELQRYLTTSTMFLTDFKIKACQNTLNDLSSSCEECRLRLIPKKKFGFSGKKVAPKVLVNPRVVNISTDKVDMPEKSKTDNTSFTWTLSNREDEYICLEGDELNNKDITISNLKNCFVELCGHAGSVQISQAIDCTFLCGPISRSLFAENCERTTLALACQQLRLHSSNICRIYLHVTCRAIIEDCTQIEIANYNYNYATIDEDFQLAGLDKAQNNYTDIADFNWLSPDVPSPNWTLLKETPLPSWSELRSQKQQKSKFL
nr:tubulin-specific chaperone C [Bactrocera oleae]XP_036214671.1 tubulin-specific chaperone C [Bactrocera oleae]XP_036214672.1 tubulin-specific chaperone C [Bactrocera oleae]XP_036214673.1 tubulin-specific chaperone C [Bactrocera oleae]XP_036214674.1 tubulin-specific chaperone C [Bactrocera oleae]XP_036214675.1 tubulin-specific chaperone C [Bactrocera oleae]XP_036214676.1 tubulin-specific chaperone C [Bactrocera oleae]XP_036214677.1 tubulin-specific chaperone C [Bactrocera oleae]XP_03621467